ncbi:MAG: stage II sporulation protein M [Ilumatobacter sp.]|nr:stage II sporulation protein M [Ilumatobacter sp.]
MDIDAFVATHQYSWQRLEHLTRQAHKLRSVGPAELDELVGLYQRTGGHLAHARLNYRADDALIGRLTYLVAEAHAVLYGTRGTDPGRSIATFFTVAFPAAVWSIRWFIAWSAALTLVPWVVLQVWIGVSPEAFDLTADEAVRTAYIEQDFEAYYSSQPAQNFASQVFLNNVRVGILAFAAGILLCVFTAAILVYNGANGGMAGGLFTHVGEWERFWGLILPHGLLEISAVIVAGGAGLRLGWTVISPGDRTRWRALTDDGRYVGNVLIGLVLAFAIAGLIEGFVTGRPWPTSVRVGIGVLAFLAFWAWPVVYGRRAATIDAEARTHERR